MRGCTLRLYALIQKIAENPAVPVKYNTLITEILLTKMYAEHPFYLS